MLITREQFSYDADNNRYLCPQGNTLTATTTQQKNDSLYQQPHRLSAMPTTRPVFRRKSQAQTPRTLGA